MAETFDQLADGYPEAGRTEPDSSPWPGETAPNGPGTGADEPEPRSSLGAYDILAPSDDEGGDEPALGTEERPFRFEDLPTDDDEPAPSVDGTVAEGDDDAPTDGARPRDPKTGRFISQEEAERLEAYRQADPLLRVIEGDQELQQMILDHLAGQRTRARVGASEDQPSGPPKPPEKPKDFDPVEAMTDPESASARYVRERDAYLEERLVWQESELARQRQEALDAIEREKAALRERAIENELRQAYGLTAEEVADFRRAMADPESMSLPNLVEFWRFQRRRKEEGDPAVRRKAEQMRQRQRRLKTPSAPAGAGGPTGERDRARSFEARMNEALFSDYDF